MSSLPIGYTQLEYIESTGVEYIDSGFVPSLNTRIIFDGRISSMDPEIFAFFGARDTASGGAMIVWSINGKYRIDVSKSSTNTTSQVVSVGDVYIDMMLGDITINGNHYNFSANAASRNTIGVFALKDTGTSYTDSNGFDTRRLIGRVNKFVIYDNEKIVRYMIPCKNENGEVGLYDVVGSKFYGNISGNGAFIAGPEKDGEIYIYTTKKEIKLLTSGKYCDKNIVVVLA